jgi:glycosyltransferase involved in cell wall biosynthesis
MNYTELTDKSKATQFSRLVDQRPIRILHVVGSMNRGGIETWLMHILRHIDRDRFKMDFLVHTTKTCVYDEEIRSLGSCIIPCPHSSKPWLYARTFKQAMLEYGSYDIVHSHVHHFNGYILRLAKQAGVPIRIAHSHNDTSFVENEAGFQRTVYLGLMKWWIAKYATMGLGASDRAATNLFGSFWETDPRWQLLFYGIDLAPFHQTVDLVAVRSELGIPADAFVVGHVGRLYEQKNHRFLLEIAVEIIKREPRMHLLLVGDGPLRSILEERVIEMDLSKQTLLIGSRSDVSRLMRGAIDVFLFPSLHEGLGLVLIEAQASGLSCVLSDVVPKEADVVEPLMHRISLSQPAAIWAEKVLAVRNNRSASQQSEALALIEQSAFNIQKGLTKLTDHYALKGH